MCTEHAVFAETERSSYYTTIVWIMFQQTRVGLMRMSFAQSFKTRFPWCGVFVRLREDRRCFFIRRNEKTPKYAWRKNTFSTLLKYTCENIFFLFTRTRDILPYITDRAGTSMGFQ